VWIGLTGIGESFINKDFLKMLEYVKSKDITVELYDTFYFIDRKTSNQLISLGIDQMLVSLDASTKETYESIRVGSDFDKVTSNVKNMFELKRSMKAPFPEISFHYIIMKNNIHEVLSYIDLVFSIAGTSAPIQFSQLLHNHEKINDLFIEIPKDTIDAIEQKAESLGMTINWNLDVPTDKPSMSKCIEWNMPFIFANGDVISCCASNESGNRNNQKKHKLGNIFRTPFKQIWNGSKYHNLRNRLINNGTPVQCLDCCIYERGGNL